MEGTVKSFNHKRGYGFIDHNGQDVFFHYTDLVMEGYRKVRPNKKVTFDIIESPGGLRATNIKIVK